MQAVKSGDCPQEKSEAYESMPAIESFKHLVLAIQTFKHLVLATLLSNFHTFKLSVFQTSGIGSLTFKLSNFQTSVIGTSLATHANV